MLPSNLEYKILITHCRNKSNTSSERIYWNQRIRTQCKNLMKSLKGYVGRYIVLSLGQTVQLNFGYMILLYNDGIPYCGEIKTWDLTAICQRNSLLPYIVLHVQGRVHRVPLQNQRRNQDSTWDHHSLHQRPLEATCYLSCEEKRKRAKNATINHLHIC